jgi:phosphoheptose isomerase
MSDPRSKNHWPEADSPSEYLLAYGRMLTQALARVPAQAIEAAFAVLESAIARGSRIYVAGNGGSAAIAGHFTCDWMKGTAAEGEPPARVHSLSENTSLLTALANDMGYEHCFSEQLKQLGEEGDVVVLISSSGNSPNMLLAAKAARRKRMEIISLTGFAGGELQSLSDVNLHVPVCNYGMAEDAHQTLMHALSQYLYRSRETAKERGTRAVTTGYLVSRQLPGHPEVPGQTEL